MAELIMNSLKRFYHRLFNKFFYSFLVRINSKYSPEKDYYRFFYKPIRIFKRKFYADYMGTRINYLPDTDVGFSLFVNNNFEEDELSICQRYLKEDSIVLDIGANIGFHTVFFSKTAKKGMVFSFEPSLKTCELLIKNVSELNNVFIFDLAVSNFTGTTKFFETSDNAFSSLKDTSRKPVIKVSNVFCVKIDDFVLPSNIAKVDFIKIDVEGFEQYAIEGMSKVIKRDSPFIFCEVFGGVNSNLDPVKTINSIIDMGYDAYVMKGRQLVKYTDHDDRYQNYLFLPQKNSILNTEKCL